MYDLIFQMIAELNALDPDTKKLRVEAELETLETLIKITES